MPRKRLPAGSPGMSLMEIVITVAITSMVGMALMVAFESATSMHMTFLAQVPVALAASHMSNHMRDMARSATCVVSPPLPPQPPAAPSVSASNTLLAFSGDDCTQKQNYFIFCLASPGQDPEKRLLYRSNVVGQINADLGESCDPNTGVGCCMVPGPNPSGWKVLSPISVETRVPQGLQPSGLFQRKSTDANMVTAKIHFIMVSLNKKTGNVDALTGRTIMDEKTFDSVFTFQAPLEPL